MKFDVGKPSLARSAKSQTTTKWKRQTERVVTADYDKCASKHKDRRIAALLSIFFGPLGVHKFYMGNWKAGVVQFAISFVAISVSGMMHTYLPFSTVCIFACAEGIVYALKSDEAFDAEEVNDGRWFL